MQPTHEPQQQALMTAAPAMLNALQQYGFALLDGCLPLQVMDAMQAEAAAAQEQAEAQVLAAGGSAGDLARHTGCVFQVLPQLGPQHPARCSSQYWQLRSLWPCQPAVAHWLRSQPLLELLQAALGSPSVLLYNEQYIIKPPNVGAASAFAWHYDSQYAGSTGRPVQYSRYLSLWVALDDMTADNGCLEVLPGARGQSHCCCCISKGGCTGTIGASVQGLHATSAQDCLSQLQQWQQQQQQCTQQPNSTCTGQPACCLCQQSPPCQVTGGCGHGSSGSSQPQNGPCNGCCHHQPPPMKLLIPAGTAILFWDATWHRSGPNSSNSTRSAYLTQFSSDALRWQDTGELIGMAVPLQQR